MQPAVAVAHTCLGKLAHAASQIMPRIFNAGVVLRASRLLQQTAGPPHLQRVVVTTYATARFFTAGRPSFLLRRPAGSLYPD